MPHEAKMKYAEIAHEFARAQYRFETELIELDPTSPLDWQRTSTDEYDDSIELLEVPNDSRLSEKQQQFIYDAGFTKCWLNHCNGWETSYPLTKDGHFRMSDGYRTNRIPAVDSL